MQAGGVEAYIKKIEVSSQTWLPV